MCQRVCFASSRPITAYKGKGRFSMLPPSSPYFKTSCWRSLKRVHGKTFMFFSSVQGLAEKAGTTTKKQGLLALRPKNSPSQIDRCVFRSLFESAKFASFAAEIGEISPENHRKNHRTTAEQKVGARTINHNISAFSNSQHLRAAQIAGLCRNHHCLGKKRKRSNKEPGNFEHEKNKANKKGGPKVSESIFQLKPQPGRHVWAKKPRISSPQFHGAKYPHTVLTLKQGWMGVLHIFVFFLHLN